MMRHDRISSLSLILKTPAIISHMLSRGYREFCGSTLTDDTAHVRFLYETPLVLKPSRQNKGRKTFHLQLK